jgi:hypothetical protein
MHVVVCDLSSRCHTDQWHAMRLKVQQRFCSDLHVRDYLLFSNKAWTTSTYGGVSNLSNWFCVCLHGRRNKSFVSACFAYFSATLQSVQTTLELIYQLGACMRFITANHTNTNLQELGLQWNFGSAFDATRKVCPTLDAITRWRSARYTTECVRRRYSIDAEFLKLLG